MSYSISIDPEIKGKWVEIQVDSQSAICELYWEDGRGEVERSILVLQALAQGDRYGYVQAPKNSCKIISAAKLLSVRKIGGLRLFFSVLLPHLQEIVSKAVSSKKMVYKKATT